MKNMIKKLLTISCTLSLLVATTTQAALTISGVSDGDLSGGNPKAIIIRAESAVADLSQWGVGSANNGLGSDGQEYTFMAGSAAAGDLFIIAGTPTSLNFFANNFVQDFTLVLGSVANVNGNDAIELFNNGALVDTYGDANVDGTGQTWDYTDGLAQRTGGSSGLFNQANYTSNAGGFSGQNEQQHIDAFVSLGLTQIPEPSSTAMLVVGMSVLFVRRR